MLLFFSSCSPVALAGHLFCSPARMTDFSFTEIAVDFYCACGAFSKQAVFDGKKAIRGGIPIVFRKCLSYVCLGLAMHCITWLFDVCIQSPLYFTGMISSGIICEKLWVAVCNPAFYTYRIVIKIIVVSIIIIALLLMSYGTVINCAVLTVGRLT